MAKTVKTAPKAEKAPKSAVKKTVAPAVASSISIAEWIKSVARARGEVGTYVKSLRDDKTVKASTSNKAMTARLEADENGKVLLARYALFAKRGSQAGLRSRAAA